MGWAYYANDNDESRQLDVEDVRAWLRRKQKMAQLKLHRSLAYSKLTIFLIIELIVDYVLFRVVCWVYAAVIGNASESRQHGRTFPAIDPIFSRRYCKVCPLSWTDACNICINRRMVCAFATALWDLPIHSMECLVNENVCLNIGRF